MKGHQYGMYCQGEEVHVEDHQLEHCDAIEVVRWDEVVARERSGNWLEMD